MRVVGALGLVVLGAVAALAAVMVHQRWWGLVLAVPATVLTAVALPAGWWTRLPFAAGFAVVLGLAMVPRGEGDYLVPGNGRGYVLIGLAFVVIMVSVATLPRPVRTT